MERDEFIEEQTQAFRETLEQSLEAARDPDALRWAIFSTGSRELEEDVLDRLVDIFLPSISGVFVFRPHDANECLALLKEAVSQLEAEKLKLSMAQEQEYVMKFGVDNGD